MEAADRHSKSLKGGEEEAVKKLSLTKLKRQSTDKTIASKPCYQCGRLNHDARNCRFREALCHYCGKKGHIAPICRAKKSAASVKPEHRQDTQCTKWVAMEKEQETASDSDDLMLLTVGEKSSPPITVDVEIDGYNLTMEVDTGAAVSIVSEETAQRLFPKAVLDKSSVNLRTYTEERMKICGEFPVEVRYRSQVMMLTLVVVAGAGPSLLGRNWLKPLRLDWKRIFSVAATVDPTKRLGTLLERYGDIFREELGTVQSFQAKLQVQPDAKAKFCKARSVPFSIKAAIDQELERLESSGILKPVAHSEWAAPIVVVPKKDGRFRVCGDYKVTINPALDVDQYPLPKPENLFATLSGGKKFTKLDLSQAYQQIRLEEQSQPYLTVNMHRGIYQYTRLPFGVASAPAIFQKVMDTLLQGIPHVLCYIDDILVTGVDDEEHFQNLEEVLGRLQKEVFRLKQTKCEFLCNSVEYLGHNIDAEGLHTTPQKLEAITKAPAPQNQQQLRSFLGLLNYYGEFIPNLSTILHPLNALLQKDRPWKWSTKCAEAFQLAKDTLTSSKVLIHYDLSLPIKLAADASSYGVGAVISHTLPDGSEQPIAFASRTLSASEKNYAQVEKEALSLVFGVKHFHQYLYGRKFTLETDHKPLLAILGPKKGIPSLAAARLQRWAILLSCYQYEIAFKATESHGNADGLSRLPLVGNQGVPYEPKELNVFNLSQINALPTTASQVQAATRNDPILSKVLHFTMTGWPEESSEAFKTS